MHQVAPCRLKIAFRQLGFDEEIAQFQIHLTTILGSVLQRDSRSDAKLGTNTGWDSKQGTDRLAAQDSRIAKNIHKQRVGAVRTFKLASRAIGFSGEEARASVDFGQPRLPGGLLQNALVRSREKVAMFPSLRLCVDNTGHRVISHLCQERIRSRGIPAAEF